MIKKEKKESIMRPDVRERISHYSDLYDADWAREAAEDGFRGFLDSIAKALPKDKYELIKDNYQLQVMYYTAFEQAYNVILWKYFDDTQHELELALDELSKLTASFKEK